MSDYLEQLNPNQREAVLFNDGPSLVIAGAGSGKTRVLTFKIAYLLEQGIAPYNVLALTFTNKAAREMKNRIAGVMGENTARSLWMGTFHSVFSRMLRREADRIGYDRDFTVYDASDSKNLIKAIIKEMALDDKQYKAASVQARISNAKNALITPEQYAQDKELVEDDIRSHRPAIRAVYSAYVNRCRLAGAMDFDDLLLKTYYLFREFPDVLARYQGLFRFILVDEYQDTNVAQHEIVSLLAAEHHRVCVVGDDAQSIYSFRGANIGNILNFKQQYPGCRLFKLEQNYRSTQNIVNAANSLIRKNKEQIEKKVFSEKQEGEKIQVLAAYSDYEEGYTVVSRIAEMRMLNQFAYRDFAILYRTNAQSRIFEEALRKQNIPYRIYGGLSFYQRKEIKDAIAYFRLITNPNDEEALKRVINYPVRGIGNTTLSKISAAASLQQVSLWTVLSDPLQFNLEVNSGTAKKLADFRDLITGFMEKNSSMNAYELGDWMIRSTGLSGELYLDKTPEGLSRIQNIEELLHGLLDFVENRNEEGIEEIKLSDFLAEISLMTDQDTDNDASADRITLMTVHSAKGLEFKNVFVAGMEEDLFPSAMSNQTQQEIEEERRLFYVAITRAEENCVISYAKSRFHNGESKFPAPSRFIRDIDPKYLKGAMETAQGTRYREQEESPRKLKERQYLPPWDEQEATTSRQRPQKLQPVSSSLQPNKTSSASPSAPGISYQGLHSGTVILHERFGRGVVISLEGNDENTKATVEFDSFGKKQLLLKFAKFKIV